MFIRCSFSVPAFLTLLAGATAVAQTDKPGVSLLLTKASAEHLDRSVLFHCEAVLDNATGKDLTVRSMFFSAFDGLELVVTAPDGKVLAQQPYVFHQSPFGPRKFALKRGLTEHELRIPIPILDLPGDAKTFKVRLVGILPGSGYQRILSSETLEIKAK